MKTGPLAYESADRRRIRDSGDLLPPLLPPQAALFHDLDGSLVELAETPDSIVVAETLPGLLQAVQQMLGGALAIVSGRRLESIDRLLAPLRLAGAGVHGAELRHSPGGAVLRGDAAPMRGIRRELQQSFASDPRIIVEDKGLSVALHYRQAPERMAECHALAADLSLSNGLTMNVGKSVVEILPPGPNKGHATRALLQHPPFAGRLPVFVGDDETDEDGIALVQELGGIGIKVGAGPSAADYRIPDVETVHRWLAASVEALGERG